MLGTIERNKVRIDWALLCFLIGSTHVKLYVKVFALCFYVIYAIAKKYRFPYPNSINKFYVAIMIVGAISSLLNGAFEHSKYFFGFSIGMIHWLVAGGVSYMLLVSAVNLSQDRVMQVLKAFFLINAIVSLSNLVVVSIDAQSIFPYWLKTSQRYGTSTGDYINGVFAASSIVNAATCSLGSLYFLYRDQLKWSVLCVVIMLLCTSNVTCLFMIITVLLVIFTGKQSYIRANALVLLFILIAGYPILSPQNLTYMNTVYKREAEQDYKKGSYNVVTYNRPEFLDREGKTDIINIKDNVGEFKIDDLGDVIENKIEGLYPPVVDRPIFFKQGFYKNVDRFRAPLNEEIHVDVSQEIKKLALINKNEKKLVKDNHSIIHPQLVKTAADRWFTRPIDKMPLDSFKGPGKMYSFIQTGYYLNSSWVHLLFGGGIGNFSSKLAMKMTGSGIEGNFPEKYLYINRDYLQYHFYTDLFYLSKNASEHSVINMADSTFNQLAGEYGLVGLCVFVVFYIGFLFTNRKKDKMIPHFTFFFLPMLVMAYWFEMISFTVVFELMVFSRIFAGSKQEYFE